MYKHEPLYKLYIKNVHTTITVIIKSRDDSSKCLGTKLVSVILNLDCWLQHQQSWHRTKI